VDPTKVGRVSDGLTAAEHDAGFLATLIDAYQYNLLLWKNKNKITFLKYQMRLNIVQVTPNRP
jgi:hypothetical protein